MDVKEQMIRGLQPFMTARSVDVSCRKEPRAYSATVLLLGFIKTVS